HRTGGFKLSTAPFSIEKLREVVGLYLSPPDNALCLPFKWTAPADSILQELHRLCSRISGTGR
ncbi:hypothetical protein, partial [Xanthomonas theicola]